MSIYRTNPSYFNWSFGQKFDSFITRLGPVKKTRHFQDEFISIKVIDIFLCLILYLNVVVRKSVLLFPGINVVLIFTRFFFVFSVALVTADGVFPHTLVQIHLANLEKRENIFKARSIIGAAKRNHTQCAINYEQKSAQIYALTCRKLYAHPDSFCFCKSCEWALLWRVMEGSSMDCLSHKLASCNLI